MDQPDTDHLTKTVIINLWDQAMVQVMVQATVQVTEHQVMVQNTAQAMDHHMVLQAMELINGVKNEVLGAEVSTPLQKDQEKITLWKNENIAILL